MSDTDASKTVIQFDSRIFRLSAIKKAAYKYINSFTTDISLEENEIVCVLMFISPTNEERLIQEFKKEVLDQDLREQIRNETEPIRKLIFALAFSKAGIVGNEQVPRD